MPYRLATPQYGVNGGNRTLDLQSHNLALYRLSYIHHMVRLAGFEPATSALEGHCSIQLSYKRLQWSGWRESDPRDQLGRLEFYHWTTPAQLLRLKNNNTCKSRCQQIFKNLLFICKIVAQTSFVLLFNGLCAILVICKMFMTTKSSLRNI